MRYATQKKGPLRRFDSIESVVAPRYTDEYHASQSTFATAYGLYVAPRTYRTAPHAVI